MKINKVMKYQNTINDLYLRDIEKDYQADSKKFSDDELIKIFQSGIQDILKDKILEAYSEYKQYESVAKAKTQNLKDESKDVVSYLFDDELQGRERYLKRLINLYHLAIGKDNDNRSDISIDEIIQFVPITRVLEYYGLQGRCVGGRIQLKCVFHEEDTPSLVIYPNTNSFYCFGCGKGGNIFNFVMEKENIDFKQAIKTIKQLM